MAEEQEHRIFVGGLAADVTERQLETAFSRFGKVIDSQIMLERNTERSRGFGFLTFADRRAVEDAIREMHGREFGDRVISVNKAEPKMGGEEPGHGPGHGYSNYSAGGRSSSYVPGNRSVGQDECFRCGRPGHWARDCPSAGAGGGRGRPFSPPRPRFGGPGNRGDRYLDDRERYVDDRFDRGRYGDRDRFDSRDDRFAHRDPYFNDRYPPPGDRFPEDRYGAPERYPQSRYPKERGFDRDGVRGSAGGPPRYEGRNYRERPGPYDRPRRAQPPSFDRY